MNTPAVIEVNRLTRTFGTFTAVDHITFDVKKGEIFGFLGANGAGKTTSMRMLSGLLKPTSGQARVAGYDVYTESEQIKQSIGYMSQQFSLYNDLTVGENIRFYGGIYGVDRKTMAEKSRRVLHRLDLAEEEHRLVGNLPLGWKQKLAFAVATIHDPEIVFLDEPTSGVDPITRRQFWDLIYEAAHFNTTVFITTHYMPEAEYCHRICIMNDGVIEALDSPARMKSNYGLDTMDEVFIRVTKQPG